MHKYITEAVLYNEFGGELDRETLDDHSIDRSLGEFLMKYGWNLSDGDTIRIVSRMVE